MRSFHNFFFWNREWELCKPSSLYPFWYPGRSLIEKIVTFVFTWNTKPNMCLINLGVQNINHIPFWQHLQLGPVKTVSQIDCFSLSAFSPTFLKNSDKNDHHWKAHVLVWLQSWNFLVYQVKFNRFSHPNEHIQRIYWYLVRLFGSVPTKLGHTFTK